MPGMVRSSVQAASEKNIEFVSDKRMRRTVQVKVPGSTANLGPGFDAVGMAFQIYTTIRFTVSDVPKVILYGDELQELPTDRTNLVYRVAEHLFKKAGKPIPPLTLEMKSEIPLTRGLGSSAAAIVGALSAANYLAGEPFNNDQLFQMASEYEGHPDNVGASLFGGIIVAVLEEGNIHYIRIKPDDRLKAMVVIPKFQLSTEKARRVLPKTYSRDDAVYSLGHAGLLVGALASGQYEMLKIAMKDRIHQPYRAALVPGMSEMLANAHKYGALGTALSGAGPTIISLLQGDPTELRYFCTETLLAHGIESTTLSLLPDCSGVQIIEDIDTPF